MRLHCITLKSDFGQNYHKKRNPSRHKTLKHRRMNADATPCRRIDVHTTLFLYCISNVSANNGSEFAVFANFTGPLFFLKDSFSRLFEQDSAYMK